MNIVSDKKKSNNYREVERMFYNYEKTKKEINYIDEEIGFLEKERNGCGSLIYQERVQTSVNVTSPVEKELELNSKKIESLKEKKHIKEKDIKRIERALENFDDDEKLLFKIRYILKIKDWSIYSEKVNVSKNKYYEIKDKMIEKSIDVMFLC